jgi:hypothetical protein
MDIRGHWKSPEKRILARRQGVDYRTTVINSGNARYDARPRVGGKITDSEHDRPVIARGNRPGRSAMRSDPSVWECELQKLYLPERRAY